MINFLYLVKRRIWRTVGSENTVKCKIALIGFIAEITAVSPFCFSVFTLHRNRLVCIVPYITAAKSLILSEIVPIIFKISETVSHSVGVFALNKRLIPIHFWRKSVTRYAPKRSGMIVRFILCYFFHFTFRRIHFRKHVGDLDVSIAFIMERTGIVKRLSRFFYFCKRRTCSRLVSERPENDARVIAVGINHFLHTGNTFFCPERAVFRNKRSRPVRFEIVFAHNHNTHSVAHFIKMS